MFNRSKALIAAFICGFRAHVAPRQPTQALKRGTEDRRFMSPLEVNKGDKGQKRHARNKTSGAATLKRSAKKRNNIRKHS